MRTITKGLIIVGLCAPLLQSCSLTSSEHYGGYSGYSYSGGLGGSPHGYHYSRPQPITSVPKSYHMSNTGSPGKHRDRDTRWIKNQKPEHYTIQVANQGSASEVAKKLHKSPKSTRSAQYRMKKGKKTSYGGVYGTYKNRQAAEKALKKLPP